MFNREEFFKKAAPILEKLYAGRNMDAVKERYVKAIDEFEALYGEADTLSVFSVAGRSEICGNHTDHNRGKVLAASIDLDIIAVAAKSKDAIIRVKSAGFPEDIVDISSLSPVEAEKGKSQALIRGVCDGFVKRGYTTGGFSAYTTSDILGGSGLSYSAAFEDMIGTILNFFYNEGKIGYIELSQISQYSENVHFGKPCGLMDQIACAAGGFVYIDFEDPSSPKTSRVDFDLAGHGYSLCIVNTGGSHANLTDDYAAVPAEMTGKVLFRFSRKLGLLDEDDLAGEPYYLDIVNLNPLPQPAPEPETGNKKKKKDDGLEGVAYRVPGRAQITLRQGNNTLLKTETPVTQFGTIEYLAAVLFNKNSTIQVLFDTTTGGLIKVER